MTLSLISWILEGFCITMATLSGFLNILFHEDVLWPVGPLPTKFRSDPSRNGSGAGGRGHKDCCFYCMICLPKIMSFWKIYCIFRFVHKYTCTNFFVMGIPSKIIGKPCKTQIKKRSPELKRKTDYIPFYPQVMFQKFKVARKGKCICKVMGIRLNAQSQLPDTLKGRYT